MVASVMLVAFRITGRIAIPVRSIMMAIVACTGWNSPLRNIIASRIQAIIITPDTVEFSNGVDSFRRKTIIPTCLLSGSKILYNIHMENFNE